MKQQMPDKSSARRPAGSSPWWSGAVIYQIYPRSFQDGNGDGIGDLPGITRRLDYLQGLGVNALWLSPIFESPMHDFGYDISDYRAIDSVFGTLEDFRTLLREARRRGIRIILDGVFNHTSHLHPWFVESRSSKTNPKRDWYIWRRKRNNWLSIFGGGAWEKDATTGEYYLHSFLKEQPDLNWRNPEVKAAVFSELKYWLDMGVAGFRFDVINFFFKDAQFRDNPFGLGPTPRPYDWQRHIFDRNRPELHELLGELRELLDRYDAMMVGEVFSETPDARLAASCLGRGDELHLSFDFSLMYTKWSAGAFRARLREYHESIHEKAWPCTVLSNHDQPRSLTRFGGRDAHERAKVLAALLMTMRGTPFLYYGEEIGMRDLKIRRSEIVDPVGKKYWPFHKGRDPARTPMQWSGSEHAGFSSARPWLPVHPEFGMCNVERQRDDPDSLLSFHKRLIACRKDHRALREGGLKIENGNRGAEDVLIYHRDELSVVLNFSNRSKAIEIPRPGKVVFSTHRDAGAALGDGAWAYPYEATIYAC
ncbi:MAG: alpha-glucosidase [Chrysiogenetes bacterium]|nr:alpha-glucosidase [Chrysiogenetes bacterium]